MRPADLKLNDTPALALLRDNPALAGIDPQALATAQDLLRLAKRLLARFAADFEAQGLSPGRYALMMALNAEGPLAPSDLAARLGITRASVTGLVTGLERDGLVAQTPGAAEDRRRKAVALTEAGTARLMATVPAVFARMAALTGPLPPDERETLRQTLARIEATLSPET